MHRPVFAGPRRRTRRALLAAALPAALAAVALPSAADAARVQMVNSGAARIASYGADAGEVNNLRVSFTSAGIVFDDQVPIRTLDSECRIDAAGNGVCPGHATEIIVNTGDRNDTIRYTAPHGGAVFAGDGADTIFGGLRQAAFGRQIERVIYRGNDSRLDVGTDTVSYREASSGVEVNLADSATTQPILANDGRPGIDREHIENDLELVEGSNFDDTLFGSDRNETFRGLNGNDVISGGAGNDTIDEGSAPDGADTISGDAGAHDRIFYSTRTSGVNVSLGDGRANDGAPGEQDNVNGSVEDIGGTNFRDVLTGGSPANTIDGFGGNDTITGGRGDDTLSAGTGNNGVTAGIGNDVIFARNNAIDDVDCGTEADTLDRDTSENRIVGCEKVQVGALGLAPKAITAKANKTARLRLSWRHPQSWRKVRKLELRLTRGGVPVGEVAIRPQAKEISADGAVEVVRKHARLAHKGKTVTARLAVRLDASLAGETLTAEVEATDTRGARQLERDAGTVRVAQ
jgi:Ca2+-binding RTX toxin-like protein